jgi:DNA-binding NtrC family response regulator
MKTLLIVDDEKLIRWALCETLRKSYLVYTAVSAEDALNLLGRVAVDAVLTDLKMPGMNGVQFVEHLRQRFPEVKVFTLSAYTCAPIARHLRERGVLECFAKPFDVAALTEALDRHLGPRQLAPTA